MAQFKVSVEASFLAEVTVEAGSRDAAQNAAEEMLKAGKLDGKLYPQHKFAWVTNKVLPTCYRGDAGKFRAALDAAGFKPEHYNNRTIFNDNSKDGMRRRLKLWNASAVYNAPQAQQELLQAELNKVFAGRITSMYFVKAPYWVSRGSSLCIKLVDIK